jgi:Uma2 family endonuclease
MTTLHLRSELAMIDATALMTADELFDYDLPGKRTELVEGRLLVREPAGLDHGRLAASLCTLLNAHVNPPAQPPLGVVLAGDPGFWIERNPDTVRAPDVAFVRRDRWPTHDTQQFGAFAPDLAIEIRSPSDRTGAVLHKVGQWLDAGVVSVWVIDPQRRTVQHFSGETITLLGEHDTLNAAPVLEGLHIPLTELWSPP